MKIREVWDIFRKFKERCRFRGWKTSENEDWVEIEDGYHNFLLTKNVHPSSFKIIVANRKCIVREGIFYKVVEPAYTAWLFSEAPHENLVSLLFENPDFSKRIALYDLSPLLSGEHVCIKLNYTSSLVFNEFENFLKKELGLKLKPYSTRRIKLENDAVTEYSIEQL